MSFATVLLTLTFISFLVVIAGLFAVLIIGGTSSTTTNPSSHDGLDPEQIRAIGDAAASIGKAYAEIKEIQDPSRTEQTDRVIDVEPKHVPNRDSETERLPDPDDPDLEEKLQE